MDSEPVGGVLSSWAVSASSTWLDMFHLPCILDLESEPRSDWQCFHAFFVKYTLLTKNGLRRNTSADARRASLEKGKKMMKTLSTSAGT